MVFSLVICFYYLNLSILSLFSSKEFFSYSFILLFFSCFYPMISVIGAGPAGSFASFNLAKQGFRVSLFEKNKRVGFPVQCTGLVTSSINRLVKLDSDIIINKVKKVRVFSDNKELFLKFKKPNFVLDRAGFDRFLADLAQSSGVRLFLNHRFLYNKSNRIVTSKGSFSFDFLVGADGPLSAVAKSNGLFTDRRFLFGLQARARLKNDNVVEFFPGVASLAWVVPEDNNVVRIGLLAESNLRHLFYDFIKSRSVKKKNILGFQAGVVPVYDPKLKAQKSNVFLVGDAAAQVKASTGGGIVQALTAARALSVSFANNLSYEKEWRKCLAWDLRLHLFLRRVLDRFRPGDWDLLLSLLNKRSCKSVLGSVDRDFPSMLLFRLLFHEPRLVYFARFLLPFQKKTF